MPSASSASDRHAALASLSEEIRAEAAREPFDVCRETYAAAARDITDPVVCAGSLEAPVCFLGRELGREEVHAGQPLIGAGGRRLRRTVHETLLGPAPKSERRFEAVLDHVLLTNMVPYRPVGNRAYGKRTVNRFRPFVERLLGDLWTGQRIVALGQQAFLWLAPYASDGAVKAAWADRERRFDTDVAVTIRGRTIQAVVIPHPSPLSPFKAQFTELLQTRLRG